MWNVQFKSLLDVECLVHTSLLEVECSVQTSLLDVDIQFKATGNVNAVIALLSSNLIVVCHDRNWHLALYIAWNGLTYLLSCICFLTGGNDNYRV